MRQGNARVSRSTSENPFNFCIDMMNECLYCGDKTEGTHTCQRIRVLLNKMMLDRQAILASRGIAATPKLYSEEP